MEKIRPLVSVTDFVTFGPLRGPMDGKNDLDYVNEKNIRQFCQSLLKNLPKSGGKT